LILLIPDGYDINADTNWFPVWTWSFLVIIYIFSIIIIIIPFTTYYIKLYKTFRDSGLKYKLRLYYLGFVILVIGWYGGTLYNTWDNNLYRSFWGFAGILIAISAGMIIYYTWGQNL
jgi:hypothetical protein